MSLPSKFANSLTCRSFFVTFFVLTLVEILRQHARFARYGISPYAGLTPIVQAGSHSRILRFTEIFDDIERGRLIAYQLPHSEPMMPLASEILILHAS